MGIILNGVCCKYRIENEFFSEFKKLSEDEIKINITTFIADLCMGYVTYWPNGGTRFTYSQLLFRNLQ